MSDLLAWDIKFREGMAGQNWLRDVLNGGGTIEVKVSKMLEFQDGPYIEYECLHRDGIWHESGILTTKADYWFFKFGKFSGGLLIETEWLRRAVRLARENGNLRQLREGSHPTKGVVVTLFDLWETRDANG